MHDGKLNNAWWEIMRRQWITEDNAQTMPDEKNRRKHHAMHDETYCTKLKYQYMQLIMENFIKTYLDWEKHQILNVIQTILK